MASWQALGNECLFNFCATDQANGAGETDEWVTPIVDETIRALAQVCLWKTQSLEHVVHAQQPLGLSSNQVAKAIGVLPDSVRRICHEKMHLSAKMAMRLGRYFGTGAAGQLRSHGAGLEIRRSPNKAFRAADLLPPQGGAIRVLASIHSHTRGKTSASPRTR